MTKCRICGKEFETCSTVFDSVLGNWKQFCDCYECALIYYQRIIESRNPKQTAKEIQNFGTEIYNDNKQEEKIIKSELIEEVQKTPYTRRRKTLDKIEE